MSRVEVLRDANQRVCGIVDQGVDLQADITVEPGYVGASTLLREHATLPLDVLDVLPPLAGNAGLRFPVHVEPGDARSAPVLGPTGTSPGSKA